MADDEFDIVCLEDSPSPPRSNSNLINILTGEETEDIVCLDQVTVFRPKSSSPAPQKHGEQSENNQLNEVFYNEEKTIDDIIQVPEPEILRNKTLAPNARKNTRTSSEEEIKESSEPPLKKLRTNSNEPTTFRLTSEIFPKHTLEVNPATETEIKAWKNRKPPLSFLSLTLIILRNSGSKSLASYEIWDYLSGLFPYYECKHDPFKGERIIARFAAQNNTYFLKSPSDIFKKSQRKLIILNPVATGEQQLVIEKLVSLRDKIWPTMFNPENLDALLEGKLHLPSVSLFRIHPRKEFHNTFSKIQDDGSNLSQLNNVELASTSNLTSKDSIETQEELASTVKDGVADSSSPKSNSSADTVVFDPVIVNCCSISEEEITDPKTESSRDQMLTENLQDYSSDILNPLEMLKTNTNFSNENAFANTVWSNEEISTNSEVVQLEGSKMNSDLGSNGNNNVASFPEIEKCIPRWTEIFPWMCWKPWIKKMFCSTCQSLHDKINSSERVIVFEANHPDDVFRVSKVLRAHSEKISHKMAIILENKSIISVLLFLLRAHFNEFVTVKEILAAFEDMVPKGPTISQDMLKITLQMVGQYLEDKIIKNLIVAKKFSLITDLCQGLLIVRWVNNENSPEEHVITSYNDVTDKSPSEYLATMGVSVKNMIVSVTNTRCQKCSRCKAIKRSACKNSTPLRFPQIDKFLIFLWRSKLLKPFYSIGTTLCKLWLGFPHKFADISKDLPLEMLSKFPSNPNTFLDIFQNFDRFKEIAKSIYTLTGSIEALGVYTIDISQYDWLVDIFPILTSINMLLADIRVIYPFVRGLDNLFNNVEKLKLFCEKAKKSLKEKKIKAIGIDASDIDDVYCLVDLTAKEHQQTIYHEGKVLVSAFNRLTVTRNLARYMTDTNVQDSANILYDKIKPHYRYEKTVMVKYLMKFLKSHPSCEKLNSCQVLEYIQNKDLSKDNNVVFTFHRLMGYFPFQRSKYERSLYDMKIYDYLFYRSAWCGIGSNIKRYLLTIILELSSRNTLSEQDMILWWKNLDK